MQAHLARDAAALRGWRGDVAAIGHVRTSALLVRLQEIGSQHFPVFFPYEGLFIRCKPVFERLLLAHIPRKRVRLAAPDHRLKNRPNCITITARGGMVHIYDSNKVSCEAREDLAQASAFALALPLDLDLVDGFVTRFDFFVLAGRFLGFPLTFGSFVFGFFFVGFAPLVAARFLGAREMPAD